MAELVKVFLVLFGALLFYGVGFSDGVSYQRQSSVSKSAEDLTLGPRRVASLERSVRPQRL